MYPYFVVVGCAQQCVAVIHDLVIYFVITVVFRIVIITVLFKLHLSLQWQETAYISTGSWCFTADVIRSFKLVCQLVYFASFAFVLHTVGICAGHKTGSANTVDISEVLFVQ